jgi:hypothetical protein
MSRAVGGKLEGSTRPALSLLSCIMACSAVSEISCVQSQGETKAACICLISSLSFENLVFSDHCFGHTVK